MRSTNKNLWIGIGVALAVLGAAMLMLQTGDDQQTAPRRDTAKRVGAPDASSAMPTQSGDVTSVDPDAHFTHFRVGPRNVKTIFPDGEIIWVGTSAGVIRYDPTNDEYRLLDTRTGLLANGVFHLGKIGGRLAVGTYGGGLSILNEAEDGWHTYNIPDGLGDGFIYDALQLDNGDVWIATWSQGQLGPVYGRKHRRSAAERLGLRAPCRQERRSLVRDRGRPGPIQGRGLAELEARRRAGCGLRACKGTDRVRHGSRPVFAAPCEAESGDGPRGNQCCL
jgi:hypothetical protein